jgi:hypothetical protein
LTSMSSWDFSSGLGRAHNLLEESMHDNFANDSLILL